jgi:hypothetical protein
MKGGGFLFNTAVEDTTTEDGNIRGGVISGHYIIRTQSDWQLYELNRVDLDKFRNGKVEGNLIDSYMPKTNFDKKLKVRLLFDEGKIKLFETDSDDNIVKPFVLPIPARCEQSYGLITVHSSHDCTLRSFFRFENVAVCTETANIGWETK